MQPQARLPCRLPNVAGLALPGTVIAADSGADTSHRAELTDDILGKHFAERHEFRVSGGIDDHVGWKFSAIAQDDAPFADSLDRNTTSHRNTPIDDEFGGAHIDVEPGRVLRSPRKKTRHRPHRSRKGSQPSAAPRKR